MKLFCQQVRSIGWSVDWLIDWLIDYIQSCWTRLIDKLEWFFLNSTATTRIRASDQLKLRNDLNRNRWLEEKGVTADPKTFRHPFAAIRSDPNLSSMRHLWSIKVPKIMEASFSLRRNWRKVFSLNEKFIQFSLKIKMQVKKAASELRVKEWD